MSQRPTRRGLFLIGGALALLAVWLIGAFVFLPRLVRAAYDGASFGPLNHLITGQAYHPVDRYLAAAARLARLGTAALVGLLVLGGIAYPFRERLSGAFSSVLRKEPTGRAFDLALTAAGLGLVMGALEAGVSWVRFRGFLTTFNNPDTLWLAPLAMATLFVLLTILTVTLTRSWKTGLSRQPLVFLCGTIGIMSVLRGLRLGLHPLAIWLVAIGVGIQMARLLTRKETTNRWIRRIALPGLAIVMAVPLFLYPASARYQVDTTAPATAESPTNVLLLVLDTVRGESMGFGGYARPTTPNLDRLASSGVVFERAIAPSPWTLPTHASMFTGRYLHELGVAWDRGLPEEFPTLAEAMGQHGYARGGFVGNVTNAGRGTGLERGFDWYVGHPRSLGSWLASTFATRRLAELAWPRLPFRWASPNRRYAPQVNADFIDWLDGLEDGPFFAFINYFDAHAPYEDHTDFSQSFDPADRSTLFTKDGREGPAEGNQARDIDAYDSSIALIDHHIGRLLEDLDARGLLESTLVIVTSDHGEQLGERRLIDHGNSLYPQALHVPLIMYGPAFLPRGTRITTPASLRDIPATVLALLDLENTSLPGESLAGRWSASDTLALTPAFAELEAAPHEGFAAGPNQLGDMKSLVDGPLHYILNGDGSEELFDLGVDPRGRFNLIETERGRAESPRLRGLIEALVPTTETVTPGGD